MNVGKLFECGEDSDAPTVSFYRVAIIGIID